MSAINPTIKSRLRVASFFDEAAKAGKVLFELHGVEVVLDPETAQTIGANLLTAAAFARKLKGPPS